MGNTSMIQIEGLTKKFKRFTLGPLDLKVERGIIVGLVGANGSGKTTIFRLIMNLLKEDSGKIHLFGETKEEVEWKKRVGYTGELLEAYDFLKIEDIKNYLSRWYSKWNEDKFHKLVKRYKIDIREKFGKCSKGTKKKIEFIFALCHEPELLLLDEPTAGVDLVSQRKMKEDLIEFMENGERSILLATHTVDEINQLCDEVVVLESGRVVHQYNKDDIYDQWARIWVSNVPEIIKKHHHTIHYEIGPAQIITDQVSVFEEILHENKVEIHQIQRLSMEEVLEFLIEGSED